MVEIAIQHTFWDLFETLISSHDCGSAVERSKSRVGDFVRGAERLDLLDL